MKNRPAYSIESVDNALHLASVLRQEGALRVTDAAERLGVSPSTAHRLLAMLVYRDFAEQLPDRRYRAGRLLRAGQRSDAPVGVLRTLAPRHLDRLVATVGESANLVVRAGTEAHFVASVESSQPLRVGDRSGRAMAAHRVSGGKALLAELSSDQLAALYGDDPDVDLDLLRREMRVIRSRGYAVNDGESEPGLYAIGKAVHTPLGGAVAAICLAMPAPRHDRSRLPQLLAALDEAVDGLGSDLRRG
ncbi:MAG: IclR family transcriptional regulator [Actinomycetota bacterium]|nr:IclR family transcriptional regulator [Actinomycetota bacterium]